MRQHSLAPLPDCILKHDVVLYRGHALAGGQISVNLTLDRLLGIVPRRTHEVIPVAGIAEAGMEFWPGVNPCPLRKFLVNYDCLRPPCLRVKVPPKRVCFSTDQDLDQ